MMFTNEEEEIKPITNAYYSKEFEYKNHELREQFNITQNEIEKVKEKTNELVAIVHNDNPKWSVKRICGYIAGCNSDLEEFGFSARTIERYLNEKNRQLIDSRYSKTKSKYHQPSTALEEFRQEKGELIDVQNNVIEHEEDTCHPIVPEDSFRSFPASTKTIEEEEEEESQEYKDKLRALERRITELEESLTTFEGRYTAIVKGQELPFIIKVDPRKRIITSLELDQKEVKKLNKF